MKKTILLCIVLLLMVYTAQAQHYINQFAVEIKGGEQVAKEVARSLGYKYVSLIEPVNDHYVFEHDEVPIRHKREAGRHVDHLQAHPQIHWAEQQISRPREKRNPVERTLTEPERRLETNAYKVLGKKYDDPMWKSAKQDWYMYDHAETPQNDSLSIKMDLGVLPVWQKGYTGRGVVITILDDGLEWNHTDLYQNYAKEASYDINDDDEDPFPRYDFTNENQHGTRCAGVIAMVAGNNFCGVGIAPHAKVGGVRMLDGPITDMVESRSVGFRVENIDIMSASWGPSDNGQMVNGPGKLSSAGFDKGITKGRRGLGTIYVWASGNGGHRGDNCACDGYASSIYTISISSTSTRLESPYYVEHCPSTFATTFSSGAYNEFQIVSATLHNQCTEDFTGTSAAAPQAAGIIALVLEANPKLTWRDVQHLIVWSASPYVLYNNEGWKTNAAGFKVNHRFGFGLMNAIDMVELAEVWQNVGLQEKCEISVHHHLPRTVAANSTVEVYIDVKKDDCMINYLEHVELVLTASYSRRGDLSLDLISAQGTNVSLMRPRDNDDDSEEGYQNWPFMSVQTWGENPHGTWKLKVFDDHQDTGNTGLINGVMLRLYGTREMPEIMKNADGHRRAYNFQLKDVVHKKFSSEESSGSFIGTLANLFNFG